MKKAKEYASLIINSDFSQESINQVFNEMVSEITEVAKIRNIQSNNGVRAILLEQQQKWTAICRIVNAKQNVLNESGWLELLNKVIPETEMIMRSA